jgi:hypothetical protein
MRYLATDSIPILSVPQMLVVERISKVDRTPFSIETTERIVGRFIGLEAITTWIQARARGL